MKRIIDVGLRMKENFIEGVISALDSNTVAIISGVGGVVIGVKEESVIEGVTAACFSYMGAAGLVGVMNVIIKEIDNLSNK